MKLIIHLTNKTLIHDYNKLGIDTYVVTSEYGTYSPIVYTLNEIKEIRKQVKKLYVNVNALYDEKELDGLKKHLDELVNIQVDGIIFQDFGVVNYIQENNYQVETIYSPQTLNTNYQTLNVYASLGINKAFVSKELPLNEQIEINEHTNMNLIYHVHGVNYMASSKRPLLTNYEKQAKVHLDGEILIQPRNQDFRCYIYEDRRGVTIYSENKYYAIDLLDKLTNFDLLYIETLYMDDKEAIDTVKLYLEAIHSIETNSYISNEYEDKLYQITDKLARTFNDEATLYHLDDIKRRDNS